MNQRQQEWSRDKECEDVLATESNGLGNKLIQKAMKKKKGNEERKISRFYKKTRVTINRHKGGQEKELMNAG